MFERLAGKLLNHFLAKYFVQNQEIEQRKSTQLKVWSGYISLENLEFRLDVVNELLQNTGIEMVSGSIASLEITIPWAKLGAPAKDDNAAVVVVVLDGVNVLLRTNYKYNDEALRQHAIASRRAALADSESYGRKETPSRSKLIQKRITEGILKDLMEKLHFHIRDLHVRLEDVLSNPANPYACGMTLESLHVQAEDEHYMEEENSSDVIRKEGQLNHFAIYWTAIDFDQSLPVEMSVLHAKGLSTMMLAKALNKCIARRGSVWASPSRGGGGAMDYAPKHTYLLRPVDATSHAALSTKPANLKERPSFVCSVTVDDLSFHIRDFQSAGILALASSMKEHTFFKQYRPYRPPVSPRENPGAWWRYAVKVVRMELRESRMRWSWSRFHQRYEMRRRYCYLYERQCRYPSTSTTSSPRSASSGALQSLSVRPAQETVDEERQTPDPHMGAPDEGAGPTTDSSGQGNPQLPTPTITNRKGPRSLNQQELIELAEIEDGIRGDLSTLDIILYRAVVNARLAGVLGSTSTTKKGSRFGNWISSAVNEDAESKREYDRLLAYLDNASKSTELSSEDKSRIAVSIRVQLERGCISLYSALESTSDQKQQYRRLHERCMDISIKTFFTELDLMGNFESYQLTLSLDDFTTSEIRSNMKEFVVVSRIDDSEMESIDDIGFATTPLIYIQMTSDPPDSPDYDIGLHARFDAVEIIVAPDSEWIHRIKDLIPSKGGMSSSTYWQNVALAQLGSLGSDRAGWLGRSARALSDHKNLDLDVQINCPVVRFSGEGECTLMLHLGQAHIVTESLAGVALGKLNYAFKDMSRYYRTSATSQPQPILANRSPKARFAPERMDMSLCDNTSLLLTPSMDSHTMAAFPASPKFGPDHFFLGGAASVASSEGRRFAGTSATPGANTRRESNFRTSHSSFYDKFHLQLSGTKIHLLDQVEDRDEIILSDFDVAISLESSVIPSDHSHCRFKARASVNNIIISVTRSSIVEISHIVQSWKRSIKGTRQMTSSAPFGVRGDGKSFSLHHELMRELKQQVEKRDDNGSDTSSAVDENEFLDVFEDDGETSWTDDNWVVNADTVLNGDDQSRKSGQKQRRARSISDVSSISDGSRKGKQKRTSSVYLNAENLARLEEGGGEDDDESDLDSDGDSFHSAISFGGRIELANTLLEDILTAEVEVSSLERKLTELSKPNKIEGDTVHPNVAKRRRQERRVVKVALDRANAELRAMKASLHDLEKTVEIDVADDTVVVEPSTPDVEVQSRNHEDMAAIRAKSILRLRRQRSSAVESVAGGNPNLNSLSNREFFQGTLVVSSFSAKVEIGSVDAEGHSFSGNLTFLTVALSHRGRSSKVFFGADSLCLSTEHSGRQQEILRGGGPRKGSIFSRVVSPDIDSFVRIALDVKQNGRDISSKGRIILGGIEVSPEASLLPSITKLVHMITQPHMPAHNAQSKSEFWCKALNTLTSLSQTRSQYTLVHDLYVRCSSLRIYIWDTNKSIIGAIVLTDTGFRTSLELSPDSARLQTDSLCGNAQLYGCSDDGRSAPKELLGRKDHQGEVFRSRLRINCTERSLIDGWASGHARKNGMKGVKDQNIDKSMAIDCHLGVRVQPLQIVPYTEFLVRFLTLRGPSPTREKTQTPSTDAIRLPNAIRWRIDASMEKTSIVFPSGTGDQMNVARMPNSALQLMGSLRLCAEHRCSDRQTMPVVRAALHDVTLIRSLDDWPIMERTMLSMEAILSHPCVTLDECSLLNRMEVPAGSYWFETAGLLGHCKPWCGFVHNSAEASTGYGICISFMTAPVKLNASSSILILLLETQSSYAKAIPRRTYLESDILTSEAAHLGLEIQAVSECSHIEVKFFDDVASAVRGGDPFSRPRFSIVSAGWFIDILRKQDDFIASMKVANFMVHDLSIHPGVRAVGMTHSHENAGSNEFLTLRVALQRRESVQIIDVTQRWGKIQLLLLPSLVDSVLSVLKDVWQTDVSNATPVQSPTQKTTSWPRETTLVRLSFETDGFECIMSSRNIFDYVRNGSNQSISVVTFRWVSSLRGFVALVRSSGCSAMELGSKLDIAEYSKIQEEVKVIETLLRFSENQLHAMLVLKSQDEDLVLAQSARRGVLSLNLDLQVTEFQALRTCVERTKGSPTGGEGGVTPTIFKVAPPVAGEQRITNPINFNAEYRLFGTLASASQHSNPLDELQLAQAFKLKADMVDVLVYIRSSAGGMHDAYRITLTPIITSLKDAQRAYQRKSKGDGEFGRKLCAVIKRAATIGSAQVKGFQVTLVPGGATRLTESPIVQFVMKNARVGFAAIDVPSNLEPTVPLGKTLLAISGALRGDQGGYELDRSDQSLVSHATIAGWLNVDVSAHYHNRRLVAWEPLIEQWTASAKFGVDLVRVLTFSPSLRSENAFVTSTKERSTSVTNFVPNAGERLRDIRRLFGSPIVNKQSDRGAEMVKCASDMPYLLLVALAPSLISSALHPTQWQELNIQHDVNQRSVMQMPGIKRMEWLKQFGHPGFTGEKRALSRDPAIQCFLSDTKPLNINLTGALIENVATYITGSSAKSAIIPHWIRNETGLTIRFLEVLDSDRLRRGEQPEPTTLASGREIPLSLKRAVSQSCDPHRAQITLELGSFEETVDRVNHSKYNVSKGSRSTTFFYKAIGRIQVDAVGVHEVSFYENTELLSQNAQKTNAAVGKIIVRISLKGGIKLVSIESPMVLCNATDQDLHCEVRDRNGIVQLWSASIPRMNEIHEGQSKALVTTPIPADMIPSIDAESSTLSLSAVMGQNKSRLDNENSSPASQVELPRPYSRNSISRGIIAERELSLLAFMKQGLPSENAVYAEFLFLSACSLRLGSFEVTPTSRPRSTTRKATASVVPQQRMLLLRAPLVITNHLPVLMKVKVRRKQQSARLTHVSSSNLVGLANSSSSNLVGLSSPTENQKKGNEPRDRQIGDEKWTDLGIVSCGKSVRWMGAQASHEVEMQVKLLDVRDKSSEHFPAWSTIATILPETASRREKDVGDYLSSMTVHDESGTPLTLSLQVSTGLGFYDNDDSGVEDVRSFATVSDQAPRVVSVSVPYWIVDSTDLELQFLSNEPIAGQVTSRHRVHGMDGAKAEPFSCLGLVDLLGNAELDQDPARTSFQVLMIGDEHASRLTMRHRPTRVQGGNQRNFQTTSSWCEPIALQASTNIVTEINGFATGSVDHDGTSSSDLEPLALRAEIVKAPSRCGGARGTRIVHIFNRYKIINEMGRDIEIISGTGRVEPITIEATNYPVAFHVDDSCPIRFRPKEFGWLWSGTINILKKRSEVTVRLVHKLRGQIIIASVECLRSAKSPSTILVFRKASQPPFRLENHTMYTFRYGQSSHFVTDESNQNWQRSHLSLDSTLLPYQHADFAWDEPDGGRKSVSIELGDSSLTGRTLLGTFDLEKIAPGSSLRLSTRGIAGQIVAVGPTRVLRLTDGKLPSVSSDDESGEMYANSFANKEGALTIPSCIEIRLFHGIGISVVDWTPQELLYISIDNLVIERNVDSSYEVVSVAVGHLSVDNQLWVTPYPVFLKVGRKQFAGRRRRNHAFELGWRRALSKQGGLMLLTNVELSIDPITIRVDGALVNHLLTMILHPAFNKQLNSSQGDQWLETEIRRVLRLGYLSQLEIPGYIQPLSNDPGNWEFFVATAAVASKIGVGSGSSRLPPTSSRIETQKVTTTQQRQNDRKLYVNKLKISNVKTEISWTGSLPTSFVGIPGILRPALTFESLPVLLRSFTSYHVYGTSQEILENVKHHYISVWRVFDILLGITVKPTFLIRAFVYTSRETLASFLDTAATWCSFAEDTLVDFIPKDMISKSMTASPTRKGVEHVSGLYRAIVGKPTLLMASSYRTWHLVLSSFASSLRYREPDGIVASRTRNPRLFAHVDGKELLVEYVEGENAGKALLSRVRAGQHLGEGYVFHTENVHLRSNDGESRADVNATTLIIMVTSERVLLLNGERKAHFCHVIWEVLFDNMVNMELDDVEGAFFCLAKFWYLIDTEHSKGNTDDRLSRFANVVVADADLGLGMLICKSLFVPQDLAKTLRLKIASVHTGMEEITSQLNLQAFGDLQTQDHK